MSVLDRFVAANEAASRRFNRAWPYPRSHFGNVYLRRVAAEIARAPGQLVVDVGAGKETPFLRHVPTGLRPRLIGIDVLAEDMAANHHLDERIVADVVADGLPFDREVDLVTSRTVVEHLADVDAFAAAVHRALRPGGRTVHLFVGRYALFAIVNRLLPDAVGRRLLFALRPASVDVGGFPAHYDRTHAGAIRQVFARHGLRVTQVAVNYEIAPYLTFLFPLFLLGRAVDAALTALGRQDLGSFVLIVAERPADG